jgi:hypothetical protein
MKPMKLGVFTVLLVTLIFQPQVGFSFSHEIDLATKFGEIYVAPIESEWTEDPLLEEAFLIKSSSNICKSFGFTNAFRYKASKKTGFWGEAKFSPKNSAVGEFILSPLFSSLCSAQTVSEYGKVCTEWVANYMVPSTLFLGTVFAIQSMDIRPICDAINISGNTLYICGSVDDSLKGLEDLALAYQFEELTCQGDLNTIHLWFFNPRIPLNSELLFGSSKFEHFSLSGK